MSRPHSLSSSSKSYYSYSELSESDSFIEKQLLKTAGSNWRRSCRISWALCLWRGGIANFTKMFFSGEEDIGDWYVFRVMKYKAFTTRIETIKGIIECVYRVSMVLLQNKPLWISAWNCRLFIGNKYFCLAFVSNFLENQSCLHFFLKIYRFSA